jgi:uncharacterized membrane protein YhaH (DUF805 family)
MPVAPPEGGWFEDPTGRHQLRWHDGRHWTDHVGDAGVAARDPARSGVQRLTLGGATVRCLQRYAVSSGRASRPEFWWFALVQFLAWSVPLVLGGAILGLPGAGAVATLAYLGLFIPGVAVAARRLHDTGRSAWWLLLPLIPFLGTITLVTFLTERGSDGVNRYGPPAPS